MTRYTWAMCDYTVQVQPESPGAVAVWQDIPEWCVITLCRYNLSHLEQWLRDNKLQDTNVQQALDPIIQASQLLQARKTDADVDCICEMCSQLTPPQVGTLLSMRHVGGEHSFFSKSLHLSNIMGPINVDWHCSSLRLYNLSNIDITVYFLHHLSSSWICTCQWLHNSGTIKKQLKILIDLHEQFECLHLSFKNVMWEIEQRVNGHTLCVLVLPDSQLLCCGLSLHSTGCQSL